jgi:hypothetical protein
MTCRFIYVLLLPLTVGTTPAAAQRAPRPVAVTTHRPVQTAAPAPQVASAAPAVSARRDSCVLPLRIALPLEVGAATVAGAVAGWWLHLSTIGALASDHGTVYRRGRRQFVNGGALIGAVAGVVVAFTDPPRDQRRCPRRGQR